MSPQALLTFHDFRCCVFENVVHDVIELRFALDIRSVTSVSSVLPQSRIMPLRIIPSTEDN